MSPGFAEDFIMDNEEKNIRSEEEKSKQLSQEDLEDVSGGRTPAHHEQSHGVKAFSPDGEEQ